MTDPRQAAEDALAEALHAASVGCRYAHAPKGEKACEEYNPGGHAALTTAILAASPALTSMLLTGAAVEGLGDVFLIDHCAPEHGIDVMVWQHDQDAAHEGTGPTLSAAIAAALGDET